MTAKVTSISGVRAAARDKAESTAVNNRAATALLVVVVVLVVIGLGSTQSASSVVGIDQASDRFFFFKRQLVGVGIGTLALLITSRINYRVYRKLALPLFIVCIALLAAVPYMSPTIGGAQRWIPLPGFNLQPSEIAKLAVIMLLAIVLDKKAKLLGKFGHFLVPVALILGSVGYLMLKQPDLGTLIVIAGAAMAVIMTSATPFRYVMAIVVGSVALATKLALSEAYRVRRFDGFLDPWGTASDQGYQLVQSYYALSNGGLFGVGLGASRARWFYLPNAHTDFIFAIIGEETGLIGSLTVVALFAVLAFAGWIVALRAPDNFGRMVAAGITVWLSFQALVNIGGVLGMLPITGIALPFVSFGSAALIVSMAALGILVNIAQQGVAGKR
ncbi:MAG TPA: putative lipid II flippase FtsW [Acidimicrobiia bacterium]